MSFPRYPKYKDSGVEWLGKVPEHWEVKRLKYACLVFPSNVDKKSVEGQPSVRLCNYTDVYYNDQITDDLDFMEATATEDQIAKFGLEAGDVVFTKDSETADDIAVPAYVPKVIPGVIYGYHLAVARPSLLTVGKFIKYYFLSTAAKYYFMNTANGLTRMGLSSHAINNLFATLPPLAEQTRIAEFLDRETARMDALIEEQKRLIELLKEKRQALISHVVTKGLNPDAPMKDSGVEWLGKIPKHWEVKPLKYVIKLNPIKSGYKGSKSIQCSFVPMEKLKLDTIELDEERLVEAVYEGYTFFEDGDILQAKVTPCFENRNMAIASSLVNRIGFGSSEINVIRPINIDVNFLYFRLQENSYIDLATSSMTGAGGLKRVPGEFILSYKTALPPINEQREIADFIKRVTKQIDGLTREAEEAIALMQERRSALISAAVTGKIMVV